MMASDGHAGVKTTGADGARAKPADSPDTSHLTARGLATRNKLLDGARAAFSSRGYNGTRIKDIVENADVSLGNFYRHFVDKNDILMAILQPLYRELREETGRKANAKPVISIDVLAERNAIYLAFYARHRKLFRVSREVAAHPGSGTFRDMWFSMRGDFIARNKGWLDSLVRSGAAPESINTAIMAEALGNMNEQLAYTRIALAKTAPSQKEVEAMALTLAQIWWRAIFSRDTA